MEDCSCETKREFDVDWPHGHETMAGNPARVLCTDRLGTAQTLVVLVNEDGLEIMGSRTRKGSFYDSDRPCARDLRNKPAPKLTLHAVIWGKGSNEDCFKRGLWSGPFTDSHNAEAFMVRKFRMHDCGHATVNARVVKLTEDTQ